MQTFAFHPYFAGSRWKCVLCNRVNELPAGYTAPGEGYWANSSQLSLVQTLFTPSCITHQSNISPPPTSQQTLFACMNSMKTTHRMQPRPVPPSLFLFLIDVSKPAIDSGMTRIACDTISDCLASLPGDGRVKVGLIAYDSAVHFFKFSVNQCI